MGPYIVVTHPTLRVRAALHHSSVIAICEQEDGASVAIVYRAGNEARIQGASESLEEILAALRIARKNDVFEIVTEVEAE